MFPVVIKDLGQSIWCCFTHVGLQEWWSISIKLLWPPKSLSISGISYGLWDGACYACVLKVPESGDGQPTCLWRWSCFSHRNSCIIRRKLWLEIVYKFLYQVWIWKIRLFQHQGCFGFGQEYAKYYDLDLWVLLWSRRQPLNFVLAIQLQGGRNTRWYA